tara:strand:- start:253 stop:1179 length:927 start_codon:yes stop_codon:yes gene_type:complete
MKRYFLIFFFSFFLFLTNNLQSNIQSSIILKVDKKIITSFDVKNKILSTLIIAGNDITQANIDQLKEQTLENLIYIKLKEIELERFDFKVNKQRVNKFINRVSGNNKEKLKNDFKSNGLDFNLWVKEIETEFKWQQFIYSNYSNKIEIDESFIDIEIKEILKSRLNNKEVNLSEIEILQNDELSNSDLISGIFDEIRKYGFEDTALKFSVSSSSSEKGNLGWINIKTLSKKINNVLKNLKPGQVSKPIIQTNSILFIKLNSERILENNDIDEELLKKNLIRRKQDELFNLYSRSHLSKLKNNSLIEYK